MGLQINSTVQSLFAQRQSAQATRRANRGIEQLASGLRITQASVDAAGLAIAERFRTSINQANQELNSFQSGVNLAQTADAGLESQSDAVQRIRELAVQAGNGTLTDEQRAAINEEAQQLLDQIGDTGQSSEFNGQKLLDGSANNVNLDADGSVQINVNESSLDSLGLNGLDLSTQAGAQDALDALDNAAFQINQDRAALGAQQNRIESAISARETQVLNDQEAESRIRDIDVARAAIERTRNQILQQAGIAGIAQANIPNTNALRLLTS